MPKFGEDGACLKCFETGCDCESSDISERTVIVDGKRRWCRICNCCGNVEAIPSTNTNCLVGFRCWNCGGQDNFDIVITTLINCHDDGTQTVGSQEEWEDDSFCACQSCHTEGIVRDFCYNDTPVANEHHCDNCGEVFDGSELLPIRDREARVDVTSSFIPSGECPSCHALCYPGLRGPSDSPRPQEPEAWGPDRSHASDCPYRLGGECNCPKSNYVEDEDVLDEVE